MNKHLNIFRTYAKENRTYQLENDLTRSLAICLQEDTLFFHEFLRFIFKSSDSIFNQLFNSVDSENEISIDIQVNSKRISNFDYIFAISLSENEMSEFWSQTLQAEYDPVCDLIITINNILIVIEAKRDNVNCTAQLYNQIFNICKLNYKEREFKKENFNDVIYPVDLNWKLLMVIASRVISFEKAIDNKNRFLSDFIELVKSHNHNWLPESTISNLKPENNRLIKKRISSAIIELCKEEHHNKLHYNDRIGIEFQKPWAQEILFSINQNGDLVCAIYPGNTKGQGYHIFNSNPKFKNTIYVINTEFYLDIMYHVKFTSFQKYFTGLWFGDDELKKELYTSSNFHNYTGRKKRDIHWNDIKTLFDNHLKYDWKEKCKWNELIENSGKTQFDLSFGYEIALTIPFDKLKKLDKERENLTPLTKLIKGINKEFENILK
jgi:regulator of replication initiation timing